MSEQDLVNAILDYLRLIGAWAIRINSGVMPIENDDGSRRIFRGAPAGTPDIIGCYRGQMLGIECKLPGNKPTKIQRETHVLIRDAGGWAIVAYEVEDVQKVLEVSHD